MGRGCPLNCVSLSLSFFFHILLNFISFTWSSHLLAPTGLCGERLSVQLLPFLQKKSESGKGTVFFSLFLFCLFVCFYQLFRERLSEKVHATIPKGIVGGFEFPVDPKKLERMAGEAMDICLRVLMESNKSRFDSYSTVVRKSVLIISHITFRDCRLHVFPTTFLEIAAYLSHKYCRTGEGN